MCSVFRSSAGARLCRIAEVRKSSRCYHGAVIRHIPEFGIAPQVVRCNVLQACSLAAGSDHVPDNVLREAAAPHLSPSGDRSKDFARTNPSGSCPLIESGFHPVRNGHRSNVATFANQINNGPVSLAHLHVVQLQTDQFRPAKATTEQHGQHRIIALGAHSVSPCMLEHFRTLFRAQPIPGPESELLDSLDAADPRSQLGTQQASIGGFVSQATHGCKLLVDVVGGQPRLGAIPGDELVDGVLVDSARSWRAETVEYCQLWQPKHSAMIVWFCFPTASHAEEMELRQASAYA